MTPRIGSLNAYKVVAALVSRGYPKKKTLATVLDEVMVDGTANDSPLSNANVSSPLLCDHRSCDTEACLKEHEYKCIDISLKSPGGGPDARATLSDVVP